VTTEKVEVVAPLNVSERTIDKFVRSQQDWVVAAQDKVEKHKQAIKKLAPKEYKDGVSIPFKGEQKKIQLKTSSLKNIKVEFDQQVFTIFLPISLAEENRHELVRLAIIDWMKRQAAIEVKTSVDIYAEKYNLFPRFIRIKTQKSRWGSCGIHNDINLNWLLILTPLEVMEYVVIHELCHIKERNHSANFWELVEQHCPDYRLHRLWLKKNGQSIMQGL